jgi:hypothetical protein
MPVERYILSQDPLFVQVHMFIRAHNIPFESHLNRTRFMIDPQSGYYLEFVLRYLDSCPPVISDI